MHVDFFEIAFIVTTQNSNNVHFSLSIFRRLVLGPCEDSKICGCASVLYKMEDYLHVAYASLLRD